MLLCLLNFEKMSKMINKLTMIKQIHQMLIQASKFDTCVQQLNIVQAEKGHLQALMPVQQCHLNVGNTLHGGMICTLVDYCSSMALVTDDQQQTGYSVDLNVCFVNPAKPGDELILTADTIKRGRALAHLEVEIRNKVTNQLIAQGRQTKYTGNAAF